MADTPIAEIVIAKLATHLGPNVAKMTIKGFAKKAGLAGHEQLTAAHLPALLEDIRPMLNVMIGKGPAEAVVADLSRLVR